MICGHRIELTPTPTQAVYLAKAAGCARFAYNWALSAWQSVYACRSVDDTVAATSDKELRKHLNSIKRTTFPWMMEVTKCAPQQAIINLGRAFKNFFDGRGRYPQFKRKGQDQRFYVDNTQFEIQEDKIHLPHIKWIRMKEALRFQGKIISATISHEAGKWYASIAVEVTTLSLKPAKNHGTVGVDLGINTLATLWKDTGTFEKIAGPKPMKEHLPKLRKLSHSLSRKVKYSKGWKKAKLKLGRLHARIANIRQDATHKLTTMLSSTYNTVVIEDLHVRGMLQKGLRGFRRALADMSFAEFRRQLEYKMQARGHLLVVADRFFPSSKRCSGCLDVFKALQRGQTQWTCSVCQTEHDRDANAAHNLWLWAQALYPLR